MEKLLTTTETQRLETLESTIEKGLQTFVEVGNALMEIRDGKLYRTTSGTFEDYCRDKWGFERRRAYQLMEAAQVVNNVNHGSHLIPANERQTRPLVSLPSEQQAEVWPLVVESAPNGKITAAHVESVVDDYIKNLDPSIRPSRYNPKLDSARPKVLYTPNGLDACQTPAYAIDPLLPYLPKNWVIWEPAAGEGNIVEALFDGGFKSVVSTDLLRDENFFEFEPDNWDCIVTNPPFSIQAKWLERCYELGRPFALLLKVDILGNKGNQELFDKYGIEVIFVSPRINFKMPYKGYDGGGAWFATAWFTWGLSIGQQMTFVKINTEEEDCGTE